MARRIRWNAHGWPQGVAAAARLGVPRVSVVASAVDVRLASPAVLRGPPWRPAGGPVRVDCTVQVVGVSAWGLMSRVDVSIKLGPTVPEVYYPTGLGGTTGLGTATGGVTSTTYPNEPLGYTRFLQHRYQAIPSGANGVAGAWGNWETGDVTIVADATEPSDDGNVVRVRFPAGLVEGNVPSCGFGGWATGSTQQSSIYAVFRFKMEGATWQGSTSAVNKMLGYLSYGNSGSDNEGYYSTQGAGVRSTFEWQFRQQGPISGARNLTQNVVLTQLLTTDAWHTVEVLHTLNTIGSSNGIYRAWVDGTLVSDYSNLVYRTVTYPEGFRYWQLRPYWGGSSSQTITTTQYIRYGSVYFSGVAI